MAKETLLEAARKFTFFPSVAELTEFFSDLEVEECGFEPKAIVDTRSDWHVQTESRWFNHNDWTKNLPNFGERDISKVGGVFSGIVEKVRRTEK